MEPPKPGYNSLSFQVRRAIRLADAQPENLARAVQALKTIDWINDVRVQGGHLRVHYDASIVNFRDIERVLDLAGLHQPAGLSWRCRSAWYRFLDANARSNALSKGGACCSRPPSPRQDRE
jgi:hypothetical protein